MATALPSCQRVGAGQAWAHQLLQLLHGLPSLWAKTGMGPNRQGVWQSAEGERWGGVRQARWDLLPKDRPSPSLMGLELGSGGRKEHTQERRVPEPGVCIGGVARGGGAGGGWGVEGSSSALTLP